MSTSAGPDWSELFAIGDVHAPEFFRKSEDLEALPKPPAQSHAIRQAFRELGVDAVLCLGNTPAVYFKDYPEIDYDVIRELHRRVWNQGLAAVLVVIGPRDVVILSGVTLPAKPEEAVRLLFSGTARPIDLARISDDRGKSSVFQNNFGIGFDAIVVMRTETITRLHGFPMYFGAVLQTIFFYYQIPYLEIMFDGEAVNQRSLFLYGGLGPRGGGGFLITPDARWDDDRIDTCLVNPVNRLVMLNMLTKVMKGSHVTSHHVTMRRNRQMSVRSTMPMPIHLDGEMFAYPRDNVRQVTITSLPAAVQVIV